MITKLKHLRFAGTYYEIGRRFGEAVRAAVEYAAPKRDILREARSYEREAKLYSPGLLEELQGFAKGLDVDYEWVLAKHLVPQRIMKCNIFFVGGRHTKSGHPFFARHMDWNEDDLQHGVMLETRPSGKNASIGFNFSYPYSGDRW